MDKKKIIIKGVNELKTGATIEQVPVQTLEYIQLENVTLQNAGSGPVASFSNDPADAEATALQNKAEKDQGCSS